jgi:hypothetical protein
MLCIPPKRWLKWNYWMVQGTLYSKMVHATIWCWLHWYIHTNYLPSYTLNPSIPCSPMKSINPSNQHEERLPQFLSKGWQENLHPPTTSIPWILWASHKSS